MMIHELFNPEMIDKYSDLLVVGSATMFVIAYFSWFIWWILGSYYSLDDWHRLPMNYMELEGIPDDALHES